MTKALEDINPYSITEREEYFYNLFFNGVMNGVEEDAVLALLFSPNLKQKKYPLNDNDVMFKPRVSFSYFLLKQNGKKLLENIIYDHDNPNQSVTTLFKKKIITNSEGEDELRFFFDQKEISFNSPALNYLAQFMPDVIEPIYKDDVIEQLKPYLLNDTEIISSFVSNLKENRNIDISYVFQTKAEEDYGDVIIGVGENMDSEYWEKKFKERQTFTELHKQELLGN